MKAMPTTDTNLRSLMNVGPAIERDLRELGVHSVRELARHSAQELFQRLQQRGVTRVDPCVYDTFRAIIHEARTGEKTPWFAWTAERKRLQAAGELDLRFDAAASAASRSASAGRRSRPPRTRRP